MLSGVAVEDLKVVPVHRIPASRLVPDGQDRSDAREARADARRDRATRRSTIADWMWEPKLDGYRVLAFIDEQGVKLRSRRGLELAADVSRGWPRSSASRR